MAIVPDDVAHQDTEHVVIDRDVSRNFGIGEGRFVRRFPQIFCS